MVVRFFVPQTSLDAWVSAAAADVQDDCLLIAAEARQYLLTEAVHVLREVGGAGDGHELVGRVKSRVSLEEQGAEIVETSMLLGEFAYDVEPGWLAIPDGDFDEHMRSTRREEARSRHPGTAPTSDEDLLSRLAAGTL
ncbi:MAG: hypothetical protein ABTD50_13500 [Polyangiaceae bacterium]|jgi:hypothetical protein